MRNLSVGMTLSKTGLDRVIRPRVSDDGQRITYSDVGNRDGYIVVGLGLTCIGAGVSVIFAMPSPVSDWLDMIVTLCAVGTLFVLAGLPIALSRRRIEFNFAQNTVTSSKWPFGAVTCDPIAKSVALRCHQVHFSPRLGSLYNYDRYALVVHGRGGILWALAISTCPESVSDYIEAQHERIRSLYAGDGPSLLARY